MIVKHRIEAEASTMQELLRDLDQVKEKLRPYTLPIAYELYERMTDNGEPHYYKARLVLAEKEQNSA